MINPFELVTAQLDRIENKLGELDTSFHRSIFNNKAEPESGHLLTIKQAAELISLSVPTIYGLVHNSLIPVSKRGKRLYFSKQELIIWIQSGRKKTITEIEEDAQNYVNNKRKKGVSHE